MLSEEILVSWVSEWLIIVFNLTAFASNVPHQGATIMLTSVDSDPYLMNADKKFGLGSRTLVVNFIITIEMP